MNTSGRLQAEDCVTGLTIDMKMTSREICDVIEKAAGWRPREDDDDLLACLTDEDVGKVLVELRAQSEQMKAGVREWRSKQKAKR